MLDFNPQLRTRVAYHVESDAIPVARANGITTVAVMPGGGIFGGEVAVMNLDGWTWEEATLRPNAGIEFNFPPIGGGGGRGGGGGGGARGGPPNVPYDQLKKQRDERLDEIARLFDGRRAYAKAGADKTDGLGARSAGAGRRAAAAARRERSTASRTSATRWRSPIA